MGILISTAVLIALYVVAVVVLDGRSSGFLDLPLPFGAFIGSALLLSGIVFWPDGKPARKPGPLAPKPETGGGPETRAPRRGADPDTVLRNPRLSVSYEGSGEDFCIVLMVPKRGAPPVSDALHARFAQAARQMALGMGGIATEAVVVLPRDWPYHPIAGEAVFRDPAAMKALARPITDCLSDRGVPQVVIDAILAGPLVTSDHGPVVSAIAILPKPSRSAAAGRQTAASGTESRAALGSGQETTIIVAFALQPADSLGAAAASVIDLDQGRMAERLRSEVGAGPGTPVRVYPASDWAAPPVSSPEMIREAAILRRIVDAAVDRLVRAGADRDIVSAILSDGVFETLHLPLTGRIILFRALTADAGRLGALTARAMPHQAAAAARSSPVSVILAFLTLTRRRPGLPDTVRIGPDAVATICDTMRDALGAPDAEVAIVWPDQWAAPTMDQAEDAVQRGSAEERVRAAAATALRQAGCDPDLISQFAAADALGLQIRTGGLIAVFAEVRVARTALGALGDTVARAPSPPDTEFRAPPEEVGSTPGNPPADPGVTCDICADHLPVRRMVQVDANVMKRLADRGYLPATLPALLRAQAADEDQLRAAWRMIVAANDTPWGLCKTCADDVDRFAHGE